MPPTRREAIARRRRGRSSPTAARRASAIVGGASGALAGHPGGCVPLRRSASAFCRVGFFRDPERVAAARRPARRLAGRRPSARGRRAMREERFLRRRRDARQHLHVAARRAREPQPGRAARSSSVQHTRGQVPRRLRRQGVARQRAERGRAATSGGGRYAHGADRRRRSRGASSAGCGPGDRVERGRALRHDHVRLARRPLPAARRAAARRDRRPRAGGRTVGRRGAARDDRGDPIVRRPAGRGASRRSARASTSCPT